MKQVQKSIEVNVPLSTAYNQWTQYEDFPQFMEGIKSVQQIDDTHLRWNAEIDGREHSWTAEIYEQQPDQLIAWRSIDGPENCGLVSFESIDTNTTRIKVEFSYETEGVVEDAGAALGFLDRRVEGDLERYKEFIESRGSETSAWRGQVDVGQAVDTE